MSTPAEPFSSASAQPLLVSTGAAVVGRRPPSSAATASAEDDILLDSFTGTDDQKLTAALACARRRRARAVRSGSLPAATPSARPAPPSPACASSARTSAGRTPRSPTPPARSRSATSPSTAATAPSPGWSAPRRPTTSWSPGSPSSPPNAVTQFYHHPYSAGTSYATTLDTLSFYGFKHVLGTPADPFSMTLVTTKGSWTCVGRPGHPVLAARLRQLPVGRRRHELRLGRAPTAASYLMRFSNLSKTAVTSPLPDRPWRVPRRSSSRDRPHSRVASTSPTASSRARTPTTRPCGALIVIKGGGVSFTNTKLNFGDGPPVVTSPTRRTPA